MDHWIDVALGGLSALLMWFIKRESSRVDELYESHNDLRIACATRTDLETKHKENQDALKEIRSDIKYLIGKRSESKS